MWGNGVRHFTPQSRGGDRARGPGRRHPPSPRRMWGGLRGEAVFSPSAAPWNDGRGGRLMRWQFYPTIAFSHRKIRDEDFEFHDHIAQILCWQFWWRSSR